MTTSPVIRVEGLSKTYVPPPWWMRMLVRTPIRSPVVALRDVSFTVGRGEICAVVGPNGAGKSTLFRILIGLSTATEGQAWIAGRDVASRSPEIRRIVGFMPADERSLFLRQTVHENLIFHGLVHGISKRDSESRIDHVLELVGLEDAKKHVGFALSAGMRARLQLARAIFHKPAILILDEPTGSIDPVAAYRLLVLIRQIAETEGVAVLMSSHRLEEIEALGKQVLLLDRGIVRYWGPLATLRDQWEVKELELKFASLEDLGQAMSKIEEAGFRVLMTEDGRPVDSDPSFKVDGGVGIGALLAALDGLSSRLVGIHQQRTPLLELFERMYRDDPPGADT